MARAGGPGAQGEAPERFRTTRQHTRDKELPAGPVQSGPARRGHERSTAGARARARARARTHGCPWPSRRRVHRLHRIPALGRSGSGHRQPAAAWRRARRFAGPIVGWRGGGLEAEWLSRVRPRRRRRRMERPLRHLEGAWPPDACARLAHALAAPAAGCWGCATPAPAAPRRPQPQLLLLLTSQLRQGGHESARVNHQYTQEGE